MTNLRTLAAAVVLLTVPTLGVWAGDLRDGVPNDVYLATYHKHNPERDYQKAHFERVWQTVEQTQICTRLMEAIQNQLSDNEREQFESVRDTLTDALEPVNWELLKDCTESVYAQKMAAPTSQHLVLLRFPNGGADGLVEGVVNLVKLAESASGGQVSLVTESIGDVELNVLQAPPGVPFSLCVGTMDDVFLFASTRELARESIDLLNDPDAAYSKFEDPRLQAALEQLPPFEDGLTFFDGKQLFKQLGGFGAFIRQTSGGAPEAERVIRFLEVIVNELNAPDYEVTVEYTDGHQNRAAVLGRVVPGTKDKVIGQMFANQQPFEDWASWVPENATSYSLSAGADLHPLYAWLMELIPEHFPEAQQGLDQFAQIQDQLDLHLDEDLLQAFGGECVSVSLPGGTPTPFGGSAGQSVSFIRCEKPERIKELLHRVVEQIQQIPQLQQQGISLVEVDDLEGFEELSAGFFAMAGIKPVIGFRDGWLICGSHAEAVQTVLDTRAGDAPNIADSEAFQQFNLEVDGPVLNIGYRNLAEETRGMAQAIQGVGTMLPMIMGMAAQQGADVDFQAIQEFFGLLPSIGQIIGTLDFYEAQLSVTQPGPDDLSYRRQSVVLIRPPEGQ